MDPRQRTRVYTAALSVDTTTDEEAVIVGAVVRTLERVGKAHAGVACSEAGHYGAAMGVPVTADVTAILHVIGRYKAAWHQTT